MSGTILRRRDRTARPPRVEHYSSAVNTLTLYAARAFGTPAAVFSVRVAILSSPSSTSYSSFAHCATIGGFTTPRGRAPPLHARLH